MFWLKVFLLSLFSLPEFTLPQVYSVLTFTPSVKEHISKVVVIGLLPLFILLWDSSLTHYRPAPRCVSSPSRYTLHWPTQDNIAWSPVWTGRTILALVLRSSYTGKHCLQACLKTFAVWVLPRCSPAEFPSCQQLHPSQTHVMQFLPQSSVNRNYCQSLVLHVLAILHQSFRSDSIYWARSTTVFYL